MLILGQFDGAHVEWGVTELSRRTGLTKSHVSKVLKQLRLSGFTVQDRASRRYRAGPRALAVGAAYAAGSNIIQPARTPLRMLARDTEAIATLNVIDGARVLFVSAAEANQSQRFSWPVGSYIPLHATAAGKIAAAIALPFDGPPPDPKSELPAFTPSTIRDRRELHHQLRNIRQCGLASTYGESTYGLAAISSPILDQDMHVVAAISLLYPIQRADDAAYRRTIEQALRQTVRTVSLAIGAPDYPYAMSA
jgi:DNA-binding IclR family transcriptional regulator